MDISKWCEGIILGPGGMNAYERYELVTWNEPERVAAAKWTIRCLANPNNKGSKKVLDAIMERRKEVNEMDSASGEGHSRISR